VGLLTLNDPARRNAVTSQMRTELIECFDGLEERSDVRAVVITGEGSAFCAGAHLADLAKAEAADFRHIYDAFLRIARSPLPTVAAVNGPAVGAGLNLALACDVRVAATSARFVARFLRLGLHPGGGNTWMLSRLVGPQVAAAMLIFGEDLDGEAAVQRGLALRCVEDELVVPEAILLAGRATDAPRELVGRLKETLIAVAGIDQLDEAVAFELEAQVWSSKQAFFRDRIESAAPPAQIKHG
jgi:enoyl-CoA hydratase